MIREFPANGGRVSGRREEYSLLLLHHTGAKPGVTRANPVAYLGDAGRYVIFAAIGGAPSSRLVPQPQGAAAHENRGGSETIDVVVAEATSRSASVSSRSKPRDTGNLPTLLEKTRRVFPVIVLTPTGSA
jgi:hypothetical protein